MVHFIGGLDAHGRALPMTFRRLKQQAETWPVTAATPAGPAALLKTAREMFAHGFYVYEFVAASCSWAVNAVEAALKLRLEQQGSFRSLIAAAEDGGILQPGTGAALHAGRDIRNGFVHEGTQPVWTFGMADQALRTPHFIVAELYPDTPEA
jgi:hypothetical protein